MAVRRVLSKPAMRPDVNVAKRMRMPVRFVKSFMKVCRVAIRPRSSRDVGRSSRANWCTIFTDCSTRRCVRAICRRKLAGLSVAACVSVVPHLRSHYRWQGAVESAEECLLVIKSSRELFASIGAVLEKEHSYEVPELLALPVVEGGTNYLNWLLANLRSGSEGE